MKKLMTWLMLSCRKSTELIEKKSLFRLSVKEKMQLQLHKSMCKACTSYEKQSEIIDGLLSKYINNDVITKDLTPNPGLKNKLLRAVNQNT